MFVRIKKTPKSKKKAVQIVKSIRIKDKVRQKIIRHVGYALNDMELKQLLMLAESIKIELEADGQGFLISPEELAASKKKSIDEKVDNPKADDDKFKINLKNIIEEDRVVSGIHDIYGALFDQMGYRHTIANPARKEMAVRIFRDIVLARIANPQSKRATVEMLEENFGISIPLEKVYRMMDELSGESIERLNRITYKNTQSLFSGKINVVFYDATTLYFESFTEDHLKRCGYSKDLKFNQPQVLLALMVTKEGLPLNYRIYEGNKYEGHTLIPALKEIRERYDIEKVIFVADSAMFNKDNLRELEENGFEYIVGARLKNMSDDLKEKILNRENYKEQKKGYEITNIVYKDNLRLVVSYRKARAEKDRLDREKAIKKLKKRLEKSKSQKEYMSNYGYKKYLKITGESNIELDEEKLKVDMKWDGLHGVITNSKDLSCDVILEQYNNLWNVEESFRITKHDLKARPIYHWSPDRIQAHLAICFTAFALIRYMEYRVRLQYKKMSPEQIRKHLVSVQTTILFDKKKKIKYALPSKISSEAKRIYGIFKMNRALTPYLIK